MFAYPAGWLADKWSREGMMIVFFVGIGMASIATAFARTPLQIGLGLFVVGVFAAIYHPVGLAIVVEKWKNTGMRIAVNGVWGNLGVASAALLTGYLIDHGGWRIAFIVPGVFSILVGIAYAVLRRREIAAESAGRNGAGGRRRGGMRPTSAACCARVGDRVPDHGGFEHRLPVDHLRAAEDVRRAAAGCRGEPGGGLALLGLPGRADVATAIGSLAFVVFALGSMAQLVVGSLLDRFGPRTVFMTAAAIQVVFFAVMPAVQNWAALAVALGFMLARSARSRSTTT